MRTPSLRLPGVPVDVIICHPTEALSVKKFCHKLNIVFNQVNISSKYRRIFLNCILNPLNQLVSS